MSGTDRPDVPLLHVNEAEHRRQIAQRANVGLPIDGTRAMTKPLPLKSYATADLPTASLWEGAIVYDSDDSAVKRSDGANWSSVSGSYDPANVAITGGTINGTSVGASTASTGRFTTIAFSAGGNTLGAYEDDTANWTPVVAFGGASTGITYTEQTGKAVIIGDFMIAQFAIQLSSKGTATGNMTITGLPEANGNGSTVEDGVTMLRMTSALSNVAISVGATASSMTLYHSRRDSVTGLGSNITDADVANNSIIFGTISYRIV